MRPDQELAAAAQLKHSIAELVKDDPDLLMTAIEGETSLLETVDWLIEESAACEAMLAGLESAAQRFADRQHRHEARREKLRTLISRAMDLCETKKLERPLATLVMANRPASVVIIDEQDIPATYFIPQPPTLNRKALAKDLKSGLHITGATLSNSPPTLTVFRS